MDKKVERVISLYNRVVDGEVLVKADEAARYGVNERSIQRDIDDIRAYFANDPESNRELVYDRTRKGYVLVQNSKKALTNSEILTVCKILLESRSLTKKEMYPIIDKLLQCIMKNLPETAKRMKLLIPYDKGAFLGRIRQDGKIFSEEYAENGTLIDALVEQQAIIGTCADASPYGECSLYWCAVPLQCDLSMGDVRFDRSCYVEGSVLAFQVDLMNLGTETVDGFTLALKDEEGQILGFRQYDTAILSGDSLTAEINYRIKTVTQGRNLTIEAAPLGKADQNNENNTVSLSLGFNDTGVSPSR